jgi:DNA-binding transcriptional LysR family regulator
MAMRGAWPVDIKRLKHVVALAEERNFARAAERVHLSQPALSRSIQAAETELGLRLFDRGTTEVTPTAAGNFVIERAKKVVQAARTLDRDVDMYSEKLIGDLAFGFGPFPGAILLKVLMLQLRQEYPGIRVRTEVSTPAYLLQHLRAEELDFFVADTRLMLGNEDLDISPLVKATGGFYVRSGHPLLEGRAVDSKDLLRFGLGSVKLPKFVRDTLSQMLALDEGTPLPLSVECDDVPTLLQVGRESDTVLLVIHAAAAEEVAMGQLVRLPMRDAPAIHAEMGIVSLRGRSLSPMAEAVIALLRQIGPKLVEME